MMNDNAAATLNSLATYAIDGRLNVSDVRRLGDYAKEAVHALEALREQNSKLLAPVALPLTAEALGRIVFSESETLRNGYDECKPDTQASVNARGVAVARAVVGALLRPECVEAALDRYDDSPTSESLQDGMRAAIQAAIAKAATLPPVKPCRTEDDYMAIIDEQGAILGCGDSETIADAARRVVAERDAIESAKDVVTRFAASLAGSVNGDEYAWALEDMKRDATRWREATAAGAGKDEALALEAYEQANPANYAWDAELGSYRRKRTTEARVVRERVQAQCAAQRDAIVGHYLTALQVTLDLGSEATWDDILAAAAEARTVQVAEGDASMAAIERAINGAPREPRPGPVCVGDTVQWDRTGDREHVVAKVTTMVELGAPIAFAIVPASDVRVTSRGPSHEAAQPTQPAPLRSGLPDVGDTVVHQCVGEARVTRGPHVRVRWKGVRDYDWVPVAELRVARRAGGGGAVGGSNG